MTSPSIPAPPGSPQDEPAPRASSEPRRRTRARGRARRKRKPPYKPKKADRALVRALAGYGTTPEEIVLIFLPRGPDRPLSLAELDRLFRSELATGRARLSAKVAERLYNATEGTSAAAVSAQRAWLQLLGGRSSGVRLEIDRDTGVVL